MAEWSESARHRSAKPATSVRIRLGAQTTNKMETTEIKLHTFYGVVKEKREFKWGGFLLLETFNGKYQCVLKEIDMTTIKHESYVQIEGELVDATIKKELVVSDVEIVVKSIKTLSEPTELPGINIYEKTVNADQNLIFDNRPYVLRNETNRCIFKIQSKIQSLFRRFLEEKEFISISTPKLVSNGAEGGTNVFKLDYFGKEAYLAQSPQFYKQMMCGVFGKVYETAPVFRAEKHNTSRHLNEYLSMDVEMVIKENMSEIILLQAELMTYIFENLCSECGDELLYLGVKELPSKSMTMTIEHAKRLLGSPISDSHSYDLTGPEEVEISKYAKEKHGADFVFLTHYGTNMRPFYTKDSKNGITTESYDVIYKGIEITSGGQRKETYEEYVQAIRSRGMKQEPFESYLSTFKVGMPLHGGFAIGLERLTAKICNVESVKMATLFPRDVDRLTP